MVAVGTTAFGQWVLNSPGLGLGLRAWVVALLPETGPKVDNQIGGPMRVLI